MVKDDASIKIKQELEESRKSEALLASLLENSSQPFGVGYPDGRLGLVNKAFEELTGYSRDELKSTDWSEILTPHKFRDMENEKLEELQSTGKPVRYEKEYLRKDGTTVPIELLVHIVKNEDGTPEYYYSFITDISERKTSEKINLELLEKEKELTEELTASNEELQSTTEEVRITNEELIHKGDELLTINKALEDSNEKLNQSLDELKNAETILSSITNLSSDLIYVKDRQSRWIFANPALIRIMGKTSDELLGKNDLEIYSNKEIGKTILENDNRIMESGKEETLEEVVETRDGMRSFISVKTPRFNENGEVIGIVGISHDITEQKRTEEALNESEEKFSKAFHSNSAAMTITRLSDGMIIDANESFETLFGYTIEETVGHSTNELGIWLTPQERDSEVEQLLKDGRLPFHEVIFGTKSGENIYVMFSVELIHIKGHEYILTTCMDFTERKKAEERNQKLLKREQELSEELQTSTEELQSTTEELYKSNEDLRKYSKMLSTIYELNPDAIVLTTVSDSRIIDCNQEYLDQIGYTREEVIGHTSKELNLISEVTREAYIDETRGNKKVSNIEIKGKRKDGSIIDVLYSTRQITVNNEEIILNIGHDITEIKKAEKQMEFDSLLLSQVNDAVLAVDNNFKITYWNKGAEKMFGYTQKEALGTNTVELLHPNYANGEREQKLEEVEKNGTLTTTMYAKHKDGTEIIVEQNVSIVFDDSGLQTGYVVADRDITKRIHIEEEMKTTMDELKRSNKELERFAYVSSHDLQEPLRMVTLYSQLLEKRYKDRLDSDADDFIEFIVENAKRMKYLIDDLLEYSRITIQAKEFENIDLEKVLENVLSNLSIPIIENDVTVTHDPLPTILGDKNQIVQVFQNLITNAIKFRGEKSPKIDISARKNEKEWIFALEDNGIGINLKHQKQIFEVFKRLHTREEYPGTGIGLSIVQKIIERHNGIIWVKSEPGKGSTFYFTIPIDK